MIIMIFLLNLTLSVGVGIYWSSTWLNNPLLGAADGVIVAGTAALWGRLHQAGEEWRQLYQTAVWWLFMALCSGLGAYVGRLMGYQTIGGLAGAALMLVLVFGVEDSSPRLIPIHGRARWATLLEALNAGVRNMALNAVWLGFYAVGQGRWGKNKRELQWLGYAPEDARSAILCAVPGAGKFSASICPTLVTNTEDNILVFDPKGQAAAVTGGSCKPGAVAWRQGLGKVVVINSFDLLPGQLLPTASVNPLADIDPDSPTAAADFKSLACICVPVREGDNQPFFAESAQEIVKTAMHHLRATEGEAATLPMVNEKLQQHEIELNKFFGEMRKSKFASVRNVGNRYYLEPYEKTAADGKKELIRPARSKGDNDVLSTVKNAMAFLSDDVMVKLFSGDNRFSFKELKQQRTDGKRVTVYIVWPASKADYAKASELLITSAMNAVLTSSNKKPGVLFIVDEFANALQKKSGGVEAIRKAFAFGRDAGLKVQIVLQTIGQLYSMLPDEKNVDEMIGAAGMFQAFGAEDETTSDRLIKMAANQTVWGPARAPFQPRPDSPMTGWEEGNQGAQSQPLLTVHDLREMKRNNGQILFLSGMDFPFRMQRQHYFSVPVFLKRTDPDPYHEREIPERFPNKL